MKDPDFFRSGKAEARCFCPSTTLSYAGRAEELVGLLLPGTGPYLCFLVPLHWDFSLPWFPSRDMAVGPLGLPPPCRTLSSSNEWPMTDRKPLRECSESESGGKSRRVKRLPLALPHSNRHPHPPLLLLSPPGRQKPHLGILFHWKAAPLSAVPSSSCRPYSTPHPHPTSSLSLCGISSRHGNSITGCDNGAFGH